jgi:hypothetical protein
VLGLFQPHIFPAGTAIRTFVDTVAVAYMPAADIFSGSDPDSVGIVGIDKLSLGTIGNNRNRIAIIARFTIMISSYQLGNFIAMAILVLLLLKDLDVVILVIQHNIHCVRMRQISINIIIELGLQLSHVRPKLGISTIISFTTGTLCQEVAGGHFIVHFYTQTVEGPVNLTSRKDLAFQILHRIPMRLDH